MIFPAAYTKYKCLQDSSTKKICVYMAIDERTLNCIKFRDCLVREILNCLYCLMAKDADKISSLVETYSKDTFSEDDWVNLVSILKLNAVVPLFLIDNYNYLQACLISEFISTRENAKDVENFISSLQGQNDFTVVFISSSNNYDFVFKGDIEPLSFQKRFPMDKHEVLLYLSLYGQNFVKNKIGSNESVILEYSDFITATASRISFYQDSGFVPLVMRHVLFKIDSHQSIFPFKGHFPFSYTDYPNFLQSTVDFIKERNIKFGREANSTELRHQVLDVLFRIYVGTKSSFDQVFLIPNFKHIFRASYSNFENNASR